MKNEFKLEILRGGLYWCGYGKYDKENKSRTKIPWRHNYFVQYLADTYACNTFSVQLLTSTGPVEGVKYWGC